MEENRGYEELDISLVKTGISLQEEYLVKQEKDGSTTAKYKLDSIKEILFERQFDPTIFVFLLAGLAVIILPYLYLSNEVLRWILYAVGVIFFIIAAAVFKKNLIIIKFDDDSVEYLAQEDPAVVKGFILSIREVLYRMEKDDAL